MVQEVEKSFSDQKVASSFSDQKVASSIPCRSVLEQGTEPPIAPYVQCAISVNVICVIYNCNGRCILTVRKRISTNKSRKLHFITFMTLHLMQKISI